MRHAYLPTGEIGAIFAGPSPEMVAHYGAQGYMVVEGPEINREDYFYKDGTLTPKSVVTLAPDKAVIVADGEDQAVVAVAVAVAGESPPASIQILVGECVEEVALVGGQGNLDPIIATSPCVIAPRVKDQITYQDNGGCAITAE